MWVRIIQRSRNAEIIYENKKTFDGSIIIKYVNFGNSKLYVHKNVSRLPDTTNSTWKQLRQTTKTTSNYTRRVTWLGVEMK